MVDSLLSLGPKWGSDGLFELKNCELYTGEINVVNLTEFSTDEEVDVELFGKVVRRVVLQNPNLRFFCRKSDF